MADKNKLEISEQLKKITKILDDKKGDDIVVIDIRNLSSFADYFVNVTANNARQLDTLADEVHRQLGKLGIEAKGSEGKANNGWILLDLGDIIVNIFGREERDKYQIEKIWGDGIITEYKAEA